MRAGVAAFDFDGTLVKGGSLGPFLVRLRGRWRFLALLARAGPAMAAAYLRCGRDGSKAALLRRVTEGLDAAHVQAVGRAFGSELAGRMAPEMAERLRWHAARGHRLLLVSASLAEYLEPFGQLAGFDEVVATRLEVAPDGRLTGRILGRNVRGPEKAARLRELLGDAEVETWAYGDSAGDRQMLAVADHPTWVRRGRPSGAKARRRALTAKPAPDTGARPPVMAPDRSD